MALPPTIPTSFVPYSASAQARKFRADYSGAFGFFAYGLLALVIVLALGVFAYGFILNGTKSKKDDALAKAEASIDVATAESFISLRDRLNSSQTLLSAHPAFSGIFTTITKLLPANARFTLLHLSLDIRGGAKLDAVGVAKSFNVLSAMSTSLAADGRIKDAIFSNIVVNQKDASVSFALSAMLDPDMVAYKPPQGLSSALTATSTPVTATSTH